VLEFDERLAAVWDCLSSGFLRKARPNVSEKENAKQRDAGSKSVEGIRYCRSANLPKVQRFRRDRVCWWMTSVDSDDAHMATVLLRQHGSGPVYPFALAKRRCAAR